MADVRLQHFVIARFADYCDFARPYPDGVRDPVQWLLSKLSELEGPLVQLKQELLEEHCRRILKKAAEDGVGEAEAADFRSLLEGYLSPGDFADAAFHLMDPAGLKDLARLKAAEGFFKGLHAARLTDEEDKPPERQSALYKRLTKELYGRLGLDTLELVRRRRPLTLRRLKMILRRCRRETAEYAAVFHFPVNPDDTFTPFILPRVEALAAANRRFLRTLRTR
ncbi:MAG: hypothetical protein KGL53_13980 [Elusimicrobia bacterium]|nr:hypothetical protein [Elusimicrobiota bacterium]